MLGNQQIEPISNTALPEGGQTYKSVFPFAVRKALLTRPDIGVKGGAYDLS